MAVAEWLRAGGAPRLETLWLFGNKLGAAGGAALAEALRSDGLLHLKGLDVRSTGLGEAERRALNKAAKSKRGRTIEIIG